MSTDGQGGGFFSRWSRQKAAERAAVKPSDKTTARAEEPVGAKLPAAAAPSAVAGTSAPAAQAKPPLPDIEQLTPQSDYTAFMAPDVAPELRSRALKKLFTDPHFNVMDGLDTYIDDYGKPDPIPESWYGRMNRIAGDMRPEPEAEQGGAATAQASQADATSLDSASAAPPTPASDSPDASTLDGANSSNALTAPDVHTASNAPTSADITKPTQAHE